MNPDPAQHHADYPPIIEQYRGPLVPPPLPGRTRVVHLEPPDFAAPFIPPAAARVPSSNANKVTFWSWLGLMCSLAAITAFFLLGGALPVSYYFRSVEYVRSELLNLLLFFIPGLLMSLWGVFKHRQGHNPRRVLVVGLFASAVDLLIIFFLIYTLITMSTTWCPSSYPGCIQPYP